MKYLVLVLAVVLFSASAFASDYIRTSKHNFAANTGWGITEICQPCHAPHNNLNAAGETLWNHKASSATYTMYKASSHNYQPNEGSLKCLGCHDGTVAVDSYGANTGSHMMGSLGTAGNALALLGTDLSNDHPISAAYTTSTTGTSYTPMAISTSGTSASIPFTYTSGTSTVSSSLRLSYQTAGANTGKFTIECSTCHSPHGTAFGDMLKRDNTGSALCLTCHLK